MTLGEIPAPETIDRTFATISRRCQRCTNPGRRARYDPALPPHFLEHIMMKPLAGIRVLAIEQFGAGPYGSMYLAELGAEVIKIENRATGGDPSRQSVSVTLAEDDSAYFQAFNLAKKSVTLNLKSDEGRALFHDLVRTSDVVWNNLRGSQPAKMGLDYAALKEV